MKSTNRFEILAYLTDDNKLKCPTLANCLEIFRNKLADHLVDYVDVQGVEIVGHKLLIYIQSSNKELQLAINKWELGNAWFKLYGFPMSNGQPFFVLSINFHGSMEYLKRCQTKNSKMRGEYFGLLEMSLICLTKDEKKKEYICIRLDLNDEKNVAIPTFLPKRLVNGGEKLRPNAREIPFENSNPKFKVSGLWDGKMASIKIWNQMQPNIVAKYSRIVPKKPGIRLLHGLWSNLEVNPRLARVNIPPNCSEKFKIIYRGFRAKKLLEQIANNREVYSWLTLRLTKEVDLHFFLKWSETEGRLVPQLTYKKPGVDAIDRETKREHEERDNCAMTLYAGAAPSYNPNLYTIDSVSRANYPWPTLSAASYTFFVNTSCAATFSLINYVPGTRSFTQAFGTQSFIVSCDYPGLKYSRKEAVKPFQLTFDTTDPSTYSIRTTYVQVNAGTGGSLGVQVLEKGNVTSDWNSTSTSPAPPDGIGHSLKVNWVPGGDERKGFLWKWIYGQPMIYYMSAAHDPVIFDVRNDPFSNRIVTGSTIQVNVKIINFVQEIYFYNGKQNVSLSTLAKGPQVFQDSVQITPNTDNLPQTQYIAAFTSYMNQSDYPGLTDYTLLDVAQNGTTNITISSKNNTQAPTFTRLSYLPMFLGNVTVTGDDTCNVELFVSGIPPPSIRDRMKLFNFNPSSTTSKTFIRSAIRSASATFIVPPNCAFSADIARMSDTIENLPIGSVGFLMSPEYPGVYENSQGYMGYTRQNSETHFCKPSASIEAKIFNANMGFYANTKGVLNVTITGTKGANSLIIDSDSPSGNRLVADGNALQLHQKMTAPRMWLWRPHMKVHSPVLERNYRCCCSFCNSVCGFKAFNYVMVFVLAITWPLYLIGAARLEGKQWWSLTLSTGTTILGLICARTLRPFYMQLYVVYAAITITMNILGCSVVLFFTSVGYFAYQDPEMKAEIRRTLADEIGPDMNINPDMYLRMGEYMLLLIIFMIFALLFFVWQLQLAFSFYFYVRDRQLEIEERESGVVRPVAAIPAPLVNKAKDLEKQDPSVFMPLNPPAYEEA
ncbi:unnamed protein product, partial [Mesorhabditis belari]|uniref:Uncharacterized protein n=1 Tax=Mesorhabditis belari TaxID=2138241 RepID=A0AAF3FMT7_9BILA